VQVDRSLRSTKTAILLNTSLFAKRGCFFVQVDRSLRSTKKAIFFGLFVFFACLSVLFYFNLLAATEDRECAHDLNYFFLLRIF
jgi:hypothetical protein